MTGGVAGGGRSPWLDAEERILGNSHEFNFWFWISNVTRRTEFHL